MAIPFRFFSLEMFIIIQYTYLHSYYTFNLAVLIYNYVQRYMTRLSSR
jgi:hypothetical protein